MITGEKTIIQESTITEIHTIEIGIATITVHIGMIGIYSGMITRIMTIVMILVVLEKAGVCHQREQHHQVVRHPRAGRCHLQDRVKVQTQAAETAAVQAESVHLIHLPLVIQEVTAQNPKQQIAIKPRKLKARDAFPKGDKNEKSTHYSDNIRRSAFWI